jgi:hypothetical protein
MHSTGSKHRHLEFGADRGSAPWFRSHSGHQVHICLNVTFCLSGEPLHTPNNSLLLWLILRATKGILDLGLCRVLWNRYLDDDMSCEKLV